MSVFSNTDRTDYTDLTLSLFLFDSFHFVILRIQIGQIVQIYTTYIHKNYHNVRFFRTRIEQIIQI